MRGCQGRQVENFELSVAKDILAVALVKSGHELLFTSMGRYNKHRKDMDRSKAARTDWRVRNRL